MAAITFESHCASAERIVNALRRLLAAFITCQLHRLSGSDIDFGQARAQIAANRSRAQNTNEKADTENENAARFHGDGWMLAILGLRTSAQFEWMS